MQIMTNIGPINRQALVDALRHDIASVDHGIQLEEIKTDWGCTLIPTRQGKKLSWRFTMNKAGQCGIFKPMSASIPQVNITLEPGRHLELRDYVLHFIRVGWI